MLSSDVNLGFTMNLNKAYNGKNIVRSIKTELTDFVIQIYGY